MKRKKQNCVLHILAYLIFMPHIIIEKRQGEMETHMCEVSRIEKDVKFYNTLPNLSTASPPQ